MTSSDSSEDENASRFREAVDVSFFKDDMFTKESKTIEVKEKPKSQRYLLNEEQQVDVRVSSDFQQRVGKKVSDLIQNQIEYVNVKDFNKKKEKLGEIEGGVKLFKDSVEFLTTDLPEEVKLDKRNRKKIKKRKLTEEEQCENGQSSQITDVVVTSDHIMSGVETQHWTSRRKQKLYRYKSDKNGKILHEVCG